MPAVVGHEGAGIVEEVGAGRRLRQARRPGDHLLAGAAASAPTALIGSRDICERPVPAALRRLPPRRLARPCKLNGEWISACYLPAVVVRHLRSRAGESRLVKVEDDDSPLGDPGGPALRHHDRRRVGIERAGSRAPGRPPGAWGRSGGPERHHGREPVPAPIRSSPSTSIAERLALALELGATHAVQRQEGRRRRPDQRTASRGVSSAFDTSGCRSSWATAVRSPAHGRHLRRGGCAGGRDSRLPAACEAVRQGPPACSSSWPARRPRASSCPS